MYIIRIKLKENKKISELKPCIIGRTCYCCGVIRYVYILPRYRWGVTWKSIWYTAISHIFSFYLVVVPAKQYTGLAFVKRGLTRDDCGRGGNFEKRERETGV